MEDVDYELLRDGSTIGWLEVKCRANASTQYGTLILSRRKFAKMGQRVRRTGLPVALAVQYLDGLFYMLVRPGVFMIERRGGRIDRRDPGDIETVVHIPMVMFREVTGGSEGSNES